MMAVLMFFGADQTGGAAESIQSKLLDWTVAYGFPALVGVVVVGLVIGYLIRMTKRGIRDGWL